MVVTQTENRQTSGFFTVRRRMRLSAPSFVCESRWVKDPQTKGRSSVQLSPVNLKSSLSLNEGCCFNPFLHISAQSHSFVCGVDTGQGSCLEGHLE